MTAIHRDLKRRGNDNEVARESLVLWKEREKVKKGILCHVH